MHHARILIAAPKSGSGKTLITCALLRALQRNHKRPVSFKCGPDYIDPMFHRSVLGIPSENLDTWFAGEEGVGQLFRESMESYGGDFAVMEGVMGLFDGLGGTGEEGSAYHLASVTNTPILLVMDVHGMGRTMIPLLSGLLSYDKKKLIRGIVLNRISASYYSIMKPLLEEELSVPVLGFFPNRKDLHLESRHLGLQLPEEISGLQEQLELAAEQLQETVDLEKLMAIGEAAGELAASRREQSLDTEEEAALTLGVARDEAFCFYYPANLRELERRGIRIREFSPLHDGCLPDGLDGLLLGGGYPELYGALLASNVSMRESIRAAIAGGLPSLAECGGFMYLHRNLIDEQGETWPMCGVLDADVSWQGHLVRFGYAQLMEKEPLFLKEGGCIKAHEFHYYDSSDNGNACKAEKPLRKTGWECMHKGPDHLWGFPHLYYPSAPELVDGFAARMREYHNKQRDRNA